MSVIPLESNPEVMNKFLVNLGVPVEWQLTDIYGLDDDALAIVQKPVLSMILLYPITKDSEEHCLKENVDLQESLKTSNSNVYYMKQYLHNACGTVALIHSVANNLSSIQLKEGSLMDFLSTSQNLTPEERGKLLQTHEGILKAHQEVAREGQTAPPPDDEELNHHFIAFVCKDGILYELDGSRPFPIPRGPSAPETLLEDASRVVKDFIARNPNTITFTLMALTPADD